MNTDNKLIADFMGINYNEDGDVLWKENFLEPRIIIKYHKSWDWLMPVVEKIQTLYEDSHTYGVVIDISTTKTSIWVEQGFYFGIEADVKNRPFDIENVYKAVVEFIKWYNNE